MAEESINPNVTLLIFLIPFFIAIAYAVFVSVRYFYWYNLKPIEPHYKRILEKYFTYYTHLTPQLKGVFERRVSLFVRAKEFYGQDGVKVTDEMRVLIAATGVQITFGFKFFQLPRFTKVFIYPKEYYSEITQKKHKGEVHPFGKVIKLSWNNFLKGFENPNDGINLGLHEMTHAMSLENSFSSNGVSSFINPSAFRVWKKFATNEIETIRTTNKSIFRKYAATNLEEFLAVSVEAFFEQTIEFYEYNPMLYKATCNLLGQDPLPGKMKR